MATPLHYRLELDVDPDTVRFSGKATIRISVDQPTRYVVLHAKGLTVETVTARVGSSVRSGKHEQRATADGRNGTELVLEFEQPLPHGTAEIEIAYQAMFGDEQRGLFRVEFAQRWYAFTQFEPTWARRMFPCFDEPSYKTPFELAITTPAGLTAFSNMPEIARRQVQRGVRYEFAPTPPLPTYLVALAVGEFDVTAGAASPVPIRLIRPKGMPGAVDPPLRAADELLGLLTEYFAHPYPFPKLDLVAVPGFSNGAMENAGLVTFRDKNLLLEKGQTSTWDERWSFQTLAHELTHQWIGNWVTLPWWDDSWLNEGVATFVEYKIVDAWRPGFGGWRNRAARLDNVMNDDERASARPIRDSVVTEDAAAEVLRRAVGYTKAAAVLSMVERFIGEEAFRSGLRSYLRAHASGTGSARDLFHALEVAGGVELGGVPESFLGQPGFPLLDVQSNCHEDRLASITVRQEPSRSGPPDGKADDRTWPLLFCPGLPNREATPCQKVVDREQTIVFDRRNVRCPIWVDPNPGLAGYYRYRVTEEQLEAAQQRIVELSPSAKFALLSNAWWSMRRHELGPDVILRFLLRLDQERDRDVIGEVAWFLVAIRKYVDEATLPAFDNYVLARLARHKATLGLIPALRGTSSGGDSRMLDAKYRIVRALGEAGDKEIVSTAIASVRRWTDGPAESLDPDWGGLQLHIAAQRADAAMFAGLADRIEHPRAPDDRRSGLAALGVVSDPLLLRNALDMALGLELHSEELDELFDRAASRPSTRKVLYDWIAERWDRIETKWKDGVPWPILNVISQASDDSEREALEKLFRSRAQAGWLDERVSTALQYRDRDRYAKPLIGSFFRKRPATKP